MSDYICYYVLSENTYSKQLENSSLVKGDRNQLVTQIQSNKTFCRNVLGISHEPFVETLKYNTTIYIKDVINNKILGACSIYLMETIIIYGICVPDNGIKRIGTLLLDNLKYIGNLIDAKSINLSADKTSVYQFYIKNGFIIDEDYPNYFGKRIHANTTYNMTYIFKKTSEGGSIKTTSSKKAKVCTIKKTSPKKIKSGTTIKEGTRKSKLPKKTKVCTRKVVLPKK